MIYGATQQAKRKPEKRLICILKTILSVKSKI